MVRPSFSSLSARSSQLILSRMNRPRTSDRIKSATVVPAKRVLSRRSRPRRSKVGSVGGRCRNTSRYVSMCVDIACHPSAPGARVRSATNSGWASVGFWETIGARSSEVIRREAVSWGMRGFKIYTYLSLRCKRKQGTAYPLLR